MHLKYHSKEIDAINRKGIRYLKHNLGAILFKTTDKTFEKCVRRKTIKPRKK